MNTNKAILYLWVIALFGVVSCKKKSDVIDSTTKCSPVLAELEKIKIFPADHPVNIDISQAALDPNSNAIIAAIGAVGLHADFGSGSWQGAPIGIPYSVVCGDQAKVAITYRANAYDGNYGNESDPGPYPIPSTATIEGYGSGDSHVLTVDIENGILYELYNASRSGNGWEASSGAVFDLKTSTYRPDGWTSADAAGLPILPCLIRYEEILGGKIDHCIRFTLSKAKVYKGYIDPARHKVNGTGTLGISLPMGAKLRLKASFDITPYSPEVQIILKAMKTYGLILSDIGSDMFITGSPDSRWKENDLSALKNVKASDFEVIKMGVIK